MNFYPRTPVECDVDVSDGQGGRLRISIHALLWSATATKRDQAKII